MLSFFLQEQENFLTCTGNWAEENNILIASQERKRYQPLSIMTLELVRHKRPPIAHYYPEVATPFWQASLESNISLLRHQSAVPCCHYEIVCSRGLSSNVLPTS